MCIRDRCYRNSTIYGALTKYFITIINLKLASSATFFQNLAEMVIYITYKRLKRKILQFFLKILQNDLRGYYGFQLYIVTCKAFLH